MKASHNIKCEQGISFVATIFCVFHSFAERIFFPYIIFFYLNISLSLSFSLIAGKHSCCFLLARHRRRCRLCELHLIHRSVWLTAGMRGMLRLCSQVALLSFSLLLLLPHTAAIVFAWVCTVHLDLYCVVARLCLFNFECCFFLLSDKKFLWIVGTTREIKNASNAQLRPNGAMNWGWRDEIPSDACDMCVFSAIYDPISGQMINCVTQMNDSSFVESNGCSGTLQGHARNHLDGTRPSI